jgi:putative acetyltransferase
MGRDVMISIRHEEPKNISQIRLVNEQAFGRRLTEAALVDALRTNQKTCLSLVAEVNEEVVGHILFSPVTIDPQPSGFAAVGFGALSRVA